MAPESDDSNIAPKGNGVAAPSEEFRADMHVHSIHSPDGMVKPADLVKEAARKGLNGMALTDHNSVAGIEEAKQAARAIPGFILVPGNEISTLKGHILAYGLKVEPIKKMSVVETVEWIIAQGGMPVAGHPYRSITGIGEKLVRSAPFAAVEVLNARMSSYKNEKARRLCEELKLGITAGSDGHRLFELGRAYMVTQEVPTGVEEMLEMIRRKRTRSGGRVATWREVAGTSTKIGKDLLIRRGRRI